MRPIVVTAVLAMLTSCGGPYGSATPGAGPVSQTTSSISASASFRVSSTTFENDERVPKSMVYHRGCKGGNRSPELSWTNAPSNAAAFAVVIHDVTANFYHWGIYNIASTATGLPENAGVPGSTLGLQVRNDYAKYYAGNRDYGGPCPPKGKVHHYVLTVYALKGKLVPLKSSAFVEDLVKALAGHIAGQTSMTGLYST